MEKYSWETAYATFLMFAVSVLFVGGTGGTVSYFSDNDLSKANELSAGLLDFSVSPENPNALFIGPESGGGSYVVENFESLVGSFTTRYRVFAQKQSGQNAFCNAIMAEATTTPFVYNGSLLSLSTGDTTTAGAWPLSLSLPDLTGIGHNDICYVDLVYRGWVDGFFEGQGYMDEERVHLVLRPRTIVLNEFLPNPEGFEYGFDFGTDDSDMPQGEWVELYNNSTVARNLSGWYIWDASGFEANKIYVTASSTASGSTVIPGHGWLVVFMNKAVLNNGGDDVRLYNASGALVDSFSYANHEVCSYEPTPGDPNALSGSGSGCDPVPGNKSYARIPDGLGAWIDPIPTPGFANSEELIENISEAFEEASSATTEETLVTETSSGSAPSPTSGHVDENTGTSTESYLAEETASSTSETLPEEGVSTSTDSVLTDGDSTSNETSEEQQGAETSTPPESTEQGTDVAVEEGQEIVVEEEVVSEEPGTTEAEAVLPESEPVPPAPEEIAPEPETPPEAPQSEPAPAEVVEAPAE